MHLVWMLHQFGRLQTHSLTHQRQLLHGGNSLFKHGGAGVQTEHINAATLHRCQALQGPGKLFHLSQFGLADCLSCGWIGKISCNHVGLWLT